MKYVYRKSTQINKFLNFNSNHLITKKRDIVKILYDGAKINFK